MKILKHGNAPECDLFRGKCYYCKTEFECLKHEGKLMNDGSISVTCPVCLRPVSAHRRDDGALVSEHKRPELTWGQKQASFPYG